jgi:hypothetical protein
MLFLLSISMSIIVGYLISLLIFGMSIFFFYHMVRFFFPGAKFFMIGIPAILSVILLLFSIPGGIPFLYLMGPYSTSDEACIGFCLLADSEMVSTMVFAENKLWCECDNRRMASMYYFYGLKEGWYWTPH